MRGATASARMGNHTLFANIARFAIIGFAVLIALEQLQIAPALINELFGGLIAAAAIAIGLAFGLGGQEMARKWLNRGESTVSTSASQLKAQQPPADSQSSTQPQRMRQFR